MRHRQIVLIVVVLTLAAGFGGNRVLAQELVFPRQFMLNGPWSRGICTMDELQQFTDEHPGSEFGLGPRTTDNLPALLTECVKKQMPRVSIWFPRRYKPHASDLDAILVNNPHLRELELHGYHMSFGFGGNPTQDFSRLKILTIAGSVAVLDEKLARQIAAFPALESLRLASVQVTERAMVELLMSRTIQTLDFSNSHIIGETPGIAFGAIPEDCPIVNLRLQGAILGEIAIKNLALLPRLQALDVPIVGDGSELATVLKSLKELRELHLDFALSAMSPETTEMLFESIGSVDSLETLTIDNLNVFPKAFASVARLPKLTSLFISPSDEMPPGIDSTIDLIGEMSQIKSLAFYGGWVNDNTIQRLEHLAALEKLRLADTHVSSIGLRQLASRYKLQSLDLRLTKITPESVEVLKTMHSLKDLRGTYISDQQMAELQTAIPNCRINGESTKGVRNRFRKN